MSRFSRNYFREIYRNGMQFVTQNLSKSNHMISEYEKPDTIILFRTE